MPMRELRQALGSLEAGQAKRLTAAEVRADVGATLHTL